MPPELIRVFGILKRAWALVNQDLGNLPSDGAKLIVHAADAAYTRPLQKKARERATPSQSGCGDLGQGKSQRAKSRAAGEGARSTRTTPSLPAAAPALSHVRIIIVMPRTDAS
jgi:hypothetical protein